jgi:hypothetical protein
LVTTDIGFMLDQGPMLDTGGEGGTHLLDAALDAALATQML